jgi:small subunit ribosomal protein S17
MAKTTVKKENNKQKTTNNKQVVKPLKKVAKPVVKVMEEKEIQKRVMKGTVVSTKMQKTVVVAIERKVAHKLYGKLIKVTKRIKADTNGMEIKEGDTVKIQLTRPLSKSKNYKVIEIEKTLKGI